MLAATFLAGCTGVQLASQPITPARPVALKQPALDTWREYEELRGSLDKDKLKAFFSSRPQVIVGRLWQVYQTCSVAKREWESAGDGLAAGEKSADFDPMQSPVAIN